MEVTKLLENVMRMLTSTAGTTPSHVSVGEAFILHQTMAALYYLRVKCRLFEHHTQSSHLKEWWGDAIKATELRIGELQQLLDKHGVPAPQSLPVVDDLTDQFMALDGVAMVAGMLQSHLIGLQASRHPDIVMFYRTLMDHTLLFGGTLGPILQEEGWLISAPEYQGNPNPAH